MLKNIYPVNIVGSHSAFTYSSLNCNKNTGYQKYIYPFFFAQLYYYSEGSRLTYIKETQTQNRGLWNFNCNLRDNGTLPIGTIF